MAPFEIKGDRAVVQPARTPATPRTEIRATLFFNSRVFLAHNHGFTHTQYNFTRPTIDSLR